MVLRIDDKYPTDADYPSAVTVSLIHNEVTVTPEAKIFIDYVKTARAKMLLTGMGGVPAVE